MLNAKKTALIIAAIGLLISVYLTIIRYSSALPLACPDKGIIDCANVLNSQYSTIFGVPNAVLGLVFFIVNLFVISRYFGKEEFVLLNAIGTVFVLYYMFTEYLIGSICIYCTGVHICTIALLLISIKCQKKTN